VIKRERAALAGHHRDISWPVLLPLDGELLPDLSGSFPCHAWSGVLGPLIRARVSSEPAASESVLPVLPGRMVLGAVEGVTLSRPCSDCDWCSNCDWPSAEGCADNFEGNDTEPASTSAAARNVAIFIQASRSQTDDADSTSGIRAGCSPLASP
jgi:hypothetical protein